MPDTSNQHHEEPIYILLTECLQNNFILSRENPLAIPETEALKMLLPLDDKNSYGDYLRDDPEAKSYKRVLSKEGEEALLRGPLYQFLAATIGEDAGLHTQRSEAGRRSKGRKTHLHVVNIKDWHVPSDTYDAERRRYGAHCEADTWEAQMIDGFEAFLEPWRANNAEIPMGTPKPWDTAGYTPHNMPYTTFYEIRSNSLYDFREDSSHLAQVMDHIIQPQEEGRRRIYIVVIGVLTDIKIKLILTQLRSRYRINQLVVSDVLTGSRNLERHLSGLDFAEKVLDVSVVHSLNELASIIHPAHGDYIPHETTKDHINYNNYKTYYLDKQNVLAFQDKQLLDYFELTRARGAQVYQQIFRVNSLLMVFGFGFLILTLALIAVRVVMPDRIPADMIFITGGLSLVQLLSVFFGRPMERIQKNLTNLVRLRNYLETYSNVTALLRHHLTTPEMLQQNELDPKELEKNDQRVSSLRKQIDLIQTMARQMSENFADIKMGMSDEEKAALSRSNPRNKPKGDEQTGEPSPSS